MKNKHKPDMLVFDMNIHLLAKPTSTKALQTIIVVFELLWIIKYAYDISFPCSLV